MSCKQFLPIHHTPFSNIQPRKSNIVEERKANLPLPDQPPQPSDWQSSDARNVNVGSGGREDLPLDTTREPVAADSAVRTDAEEMKTHTAVGGAREGKDDLGGIPSDAVTREARGKAGLADTMGKDYGYPQQSDPSSGIKK